MSKQEWWEITVKRHLNKPFPKWSWFARIEVEYFQAGKFGKLNSEFRKVKIWTEEMMEIYD